MRKRVYLVLMLGLLSMIQAKAYDFESGGIYYNKLTKQVNKVEVTKNSQTPYTDSSITIPATVTYSGVSYDVISIESYAFKGCSNLTDISIPASVLNIGARAFYNCSSLSSISIADNVFSIEKDAFEGTAWYNSQPDGLVYAGKVLYMYKGSVPADFVLEVLPGTLGIAEHSFYECDKLKQVSIPESVKHIGEFAFRGCRNLQIVNYNAIDSKSGTFSNYMNNYFSHGFIFIECSSLETVNIGPNVQTIPPYLFSDCTGLLSITIPENVTFIGNSIFDGCLALKSVYFNATDCTSGGAEFTNCSSLTSVIFGENVKRIPLRIFRACTGLTSVTIPEGIISIGDEAFSYCTNLTTVNYNAINCGGSAYNVFENTQLMNLTIGDNVQTIPTALFSNCVHLKTLTLPNSITSIGERAFYNCIQLSGELILPPNLKHLGDYAFNNCRNFTSVTIPEGITSASATFSDCTGLTTVNYNAINCSSTFLFSNCTNISTLNIGENVESLPSLTFRDLEKLTSITIPKNITSIGAAAFFGCTGLKTVNYNAVNATSTNEVSNIFVGCTSLQTVNFGENVESIPSSIFWGCSKISSLSLPENLVSIGSNAFYQCSNISGELLIPETVTSIGNSAFGHCKGITDVVLPLSVSSLGEYTFYNCTGLANIISPNQTPPLCNNNTFDGVDVNTCVLHVPVGRRDLYERARGWRDFMKIIEDIDYRQEQIIVFPELPAKTYGDADFELNATNSSNTPITYESSNTNVATIIGNTVTITGAGETYITALSEEDDNYLAAEPKQQLLIVGKASQTITFNILTNKIYGDEPFTLNAESSTSLPITYTSSDPDKLYISGNQTTILGAGSFTITAEQAGDANYLPSSESELIYISKAQLIISADDKEKYYGDENPELTYSFEGFKNGDTKEVIKTQPTISCVADRESPVGRYTITITGVEDEDNYTFTYEIGRLDIKKALLSVKAYDQSRKYGDDNPPFTVSYLGFKNDENTDVLSEVPVATSSATAASEVGVYDIVVSGGDAVNYAFDYPSGKLFIEKSILTIVAEEKTKKTGERNPDFTLQFYDFKNNDDVSVLDELPIITCIADETSPAGFYDIVLSGGLDNNYLYNMINGKMEVIQTSGIDDITNLNLSIYPNPAKEYLHIISDSSIERVEIYNQLGNLVIREFNFADKINVSSLNEGIYLVSIYLENRIITKKIIVE